MGMKRIVVGLMLMAAMGFGGSAQDEAAQNGSTEVERSLLMAHFMWTAELCREPLRRMAQGKPKRPSAAAAE